jgi:Flp pilus assembly protein TadD
LKQAIRELRLAIQLRPSYAEAHYNLGLALQSDGESQAANKQFQLAQQLQRQ